MIGTVQELILLAVRETPGIHPLLLKQTVSDRLASNTGLKLGGSVEKTCTTLERRGLITSKQISAVGRKGAPRKSMTITQAGREALEQNQKAREMIQRLAIDAMVEFCSDKLGE